jgi:UDP-N-acetylglucosamine acyltransferase
MGLTTIGRDNTFYPNAVIGAPPQDLKYNGEPTQVQIGDGNIFREAVTIHRGTVYGSKIHGGGITRVGNHNLMMVNAHAAHDVQIGDHCILANNVMLAGHVVVGNNAILSGSAGITSFVTIGDFSYIAGATRISHDVPPFVKVDDDKVRALNSVGLRRAGFSDSDIQALEDATRELFIAREKPLSVMLKDYENGHATTQHVRHLVEFLRRRDSGKFGRYLEGLR